MITRAKKSIAGFRLREGMPIGAKVTLRGERMYEFLQKLIALSLPRVRDFRGSRWLGIRPTVRGSVMNPNDHPHGGGEGRAPIGRKSPMSPWGKPTLGYKTRQRNKPSDKYIVPIHLWQRRLELISA